MSLLALCEVNYVYAASQEQCMRSEEEYLENMYIYKMLGEKHSIKEETVWEFLTKLRYNTQQTHS